MSSLHFLISKFDESIVHPFVGTVDFSITGLFLVDLPDGMAIDTPTSYLNLKALKQAGISALYPDFPNIEYNELDNATKADASATGHRAEVGSYDWMVKAQDGATPGKLTTSATTIVAPKQLVPFFSVYSIDTSIGEANDIQRTYVEELPTAITVEISTNNGSNWDTVTDQTSFFSTVASTSLLWRFTNTAARDLYLGYYAVVWRT